MFKLNLINLEIVIDTIFIVKIIFTAFFGYVIKINFQYLLNQQWLNTFNNLAIFTILPATGFIITSVISGNIALSLGMVGALSIIRFRTPIKNPLELVIYFILLTLGITMSVSVDKAIMFIIVVIVISFILKIYNKKFTTSIVYENFNNSNYFVEFKSNDVLKDVLSSKYFTSFSKYEKNYIYKLKFYSYEEIENFLNSNNVSLNDCLIEKNETFF